MVLRLFEWQLNAGLKIVAMALLTILLYLGTHWFCGRFMSVPPLEEFQNVAGILNDALQQLPFVGEIVGGAAAIVGLTLPAASFTVRSFIEQVLSGFVLTLVFDLLNLSYRFVRQMVDATFGFGKLATFLSDSMGYSILAFMAAVISTLLNNLLGHLCADTAWKLVAVILLGCTLLVLYSFEISGREAPRIKVVLKLLYDVGTVFLIYVTLFCIRCFSNFPAMTQVQQASCVVFSIIGIMGLTFIGAFAISGIYPGK